MDYTILAATPAYHGDVTLEYHRSYISMLRECNERKVELHQFFTSNSFVSHSRNTAASIVLATPAITHLLCIDADMGWPETLLFRFLEEDKQIIGAAYPMRANDQRFIFEPVIKGFQVLNGFARAKAVGCGFLLIRRDALEVMRDVYPERTYKDDVTPALQFYDLFPSGADLARGKVMTDDIGFCNLARHAGLTVWADLNAPMTHSGPSTVNKGTFLENFSR